MIGWDTISDLAVERAMLGWEEPIVFRGRVSLRKDPDTGELIPLTIRKFDNHLLAFLLEHRHPAYARVPHSEESSGSMEERLRSMEERLQAGRRRVAEARQIKTPA